MRGFFMGDDVLLSEYNACVKEDVFYVRMQTILPQGGIRKNDRGGGTPKEVEAMVSQEIQLKQ